MAKKKVYDNPIDKNIPWDGNEKTEYLPVKGTRIEEFIKNNLNSKMGVLYYDISNNRYLVFADKESQDTYIEDSTKTELILGTFDAPFNYTAEIKMLTPMYNAVFYGSTGNYIQFTYDIKNKNGLSTGENANVVITCIWNGTKKEYRQIVHSGDIVTFNIDDKLKEGTNTIIIGITGQSSLAATTVAVTYQSINLQLSDELDISKVYDLSSESKIVTVPFSISGVGTKVVEWYIDGVLQEFDKDVDEVVETSTTRTKYITLNNLNQGRHSLQLRAYTTVNGEKFYTNTLYRELLVYTGIDQNTIIGIAFDIPKEYGILEANGNPTIYDMVQYIPYTLRFATYSPKNAIGLNAQVFLGENIIGEYSVNNNTENYCIITPKKSGNQVLSLKVGEISYNITSIVQNTSMDIQEITDALLLNFNCEGKNNNSTNKDYWTYNDYEATFEGFDWNETSGWNDGRLIINKGNTFSINFAPLLNKPTQNGRTIEFEFSTFNVDDDDAIICDLRNNKGYGILITATKAKLISEAGKIIETDFKSDENVRISFVINKSSGSTFKQLSFIYTNGVNSRCINWDSKDDYTSNTTIKFEGSEGACVKLKSILVYDKALTDNQMLNNFELYRDTLEEMLEVYNRNNVYMDNSETFSPEKMASRLPYMLITGNIPILEETSDKDTQITVDVEFKNLQDPTRSFTMKGAALRPQGTSSMGYPKKNYRLYSRKLDATIVYDYQGNKINDRLYSFTEGAQPVDCWCFKADYAESSGTHNTSIARLWGNAYKNALVTTKSLDDSNEHYVVEQNTLRTNAQQIAIDNDYPYDVRTTIDGFPFLLFYRPTVNDNPIFIGKYNFNNDKSTESVFGFTGIEGFDNSRMQCWELLNNGNVLGLFQTVSNFDLDWKEAFEARYPDKSTNVADLKAFCTWMSSVTKEDFINQKWEHMDVFKMAGYYCYLVRHAAADQFVKNSMLTSEDGEHFYFILYDNDTINGLTNDSRLIIPYDADRNTIGSDGQYLFAGHDSRLWNMLEDDEEFMNIVRDVDNALYSAGINYKNVVKFFDEEQADKWVERVYNQDAQYKYIGPFLTKGTNNLHMLQGKRDLHRRYWLAKRYAIYDSKFLTGGFKSNIIEIKCINDTPSGQEITIVAGDNLEYGYGINNIIRESNIALNKGESYTFNIKQVLNIGDPLAIYGAPYIKSINLSKMTDRLNLVNIDGVYDSTLGSKLEELIIGNKGKTNNQVLEISGLKMAKKLKTLDVQGMKGITSLDLREQKSLNYLLAFGSGIVNITYAKGAPILGLELPSTLTVFNVEQLPNLSVPSIKFEDISTLREIIIKNCPNLSNKFDWIYEWYKTKLVPNDEAVLEIDNVDWKNVDYTKLIELANIGVLNLKGKIYLSEGSQEIITEIKEAFGERVFDKTSDLYIQAPDGIYISGKSKVLEGESTRYICAVFSEEEGKVQFSLTTTRQGCSIDKDTGVLTTTENGLATSDIVVRAVFISNSGNILNSTMTVTVEKRTYPTAIEITGDALINTSSALFNLTTTPIEVTGLYSVVWTLASDASEFLEIESYSDTHCKIRKIKEGMLETTLTVKLIKQLNGSSIISATKNLSLVIDGVVLTKASNPGLQACLYDNGLVAHEDYSEKWELALITADQLQPGTGNSIFYSYRLKITNLDVFEYFTGVTTIKAGTFQYCGKFDSIKIPNSVVSIGDYAFEQCFELKTVTIPNSVTSIGSGAFKQCNGITGVYISSLDAWGNITFYDSYSTPIKYATNANLYLNNEIVTEVEVPEVVRNYSFSGCKNIQKFTIKYPIKAGSVFEECTGTLVLENGDFAFTTFSRSKFHKLIIGEQVSSFSGLDQITTLNEISVYPTNTKYDSREECNAIIETSTNILVRGCSTTIIPNSVIGIKSSAFENCQNLVNITIPDSVTSIGDGAFEGCDDLVSVTFSKNITYIGSRAFYSCDKLSDIDLSTSLSLSTIWDGAFANCSNLKSIKLPDSLVTIKYEAFKSCMSLTSIVIPNSVTTIGYSAFNYCIRLETVNIPPMVSSIESSLFYNCSSLSSIDIPASVSSISSGAFQGCKSLKQITSRRASAQSVSSSTFGSSTSDYTGRNTYNTGENILYVPQGATGYESSYWLSVLLDATKCGFTISYTL